MGKGNEACLNGLGHITKMSARPIYGKIIKNLLLQSQTTDDLDTWYAGKGTQVLHKLFKLGPLVDLGHFSSEIKFGHLGFCMGKK